MISNRISSNILIGAYQQAPSDELTKTERVQAAGLQHSVILSSSQKGRQNENKQSSDSSEPKDKVELSSSQLDERELQIIQQLKTVERKVQAHERAHKAVGGRFTGAISYEYTNGPDGKRYINGGEVPIHAPQGDNPRETMQIMEQVQRAALAPMDPSPQDMAVAAQAAQKKMQAVQELNQEIMDKDQSLKEAKLQSGYAATASGTELTNTDPADRKSKPDNTILEMDYSRKTKSDAEKRQEDNISQKNNTKTMMFVEQLKKIVKQVTPGAESTARILDIVA